MGLLKKCDTSNHLIANRSGSQHPIRPVRHAVKAGPSTIETKVVSANGLTFAEDFLLEHSVSGLHIVKIGISGGSAALPKERPESCQFFGFPS